MSLLRNLPTHIFIPQCTFANLLVKNTNRFYFQNKKYVIETHPPKHIDHNIYIKPLKNIFENKYSSGSVTVIEDLTNKKPILKIETILETKFFPSGQNFTINENIKYPIGHTKKSVFCDYSVIVKDLDCKETYIWNEQQCNKMLKNKNIPFIIYALYNEVVDKKN